MVVSGPGGPASLPVLAPESRETGRQAKQSEMTRLFPDSPFVVLHHFFPNPDSVAEHRDLMIRDPHVAAGTHPLATWRIPDWPPPESQSALRIVNHRDHYLDYEGPLGQGRGEVRRDCRGVCQWLNCDPRTWHVRLIPDEAPGFLEIRLTCQDHHESPDCWQMECRMEA